MHAPFWAFFVKPIFSSEAIILVQELPFCEILKNLPKLKNLRGNTGVANELGLGNISERQFY